VSGQVEGEWCADDNKDVLEKLYRDDDFRPEKYNFGFGWRTPGHCLQGDAIVSLNRRLMVLPAKLLKEYNC